MNPLCSHMEAFLSCHLGLWLGPLLWWIGVVFRPPVSEVCPDYEVVVFQPRTVISPHLGSRRLTVHFILTLLLHLFLLSFLDHLFPPLSYLLPIRSRLSSRSSRFTLSPSLLPLRSAAHLGAALTRHPPPATCHPPLLVPAPCTACLCLPLFPVTVCYPLFCHWLTPRSLSAPGGFARHRPLHASMSLPCPPKFSSEYWHRPVLGIVFRWIFETIQEARAPPLPGSRMS